MKIRNILFSLLVLALLVSCPVMIVFFQEPQLVSIKENRNLATIDDLKETSFWDSSFQNGLEDALADQFPSRYPIVNLKNKIDLAVKNIFVPANGDELVLTMTNTNNVYQVGNSNYLMNGILLYDENYEERFRNRAHGLNALAEDYPEIDFYMYKCTQIHESNIFDEKNEIKSYGSFYEDILREELDIPYDEFDIDTLDDYKNYFYGSDHHWNYQGSYLGYTEIIKLIYGEDEKVLLPQELVSFDGKLVFSGTFSSRTGYVYEGDVFQLYTFDLPEYTVYENGVEVQNLMNMNIFSEQSDIPSEGYYYGDANPNYGPVSTWVSEHTDKPSLLLIGDSYTGPVLPLLMEHFSVVYFIQPFDYYLNNGYQYFDYDQFFAENEVDKVLHMYTVENYFYVEYGDGYINEKYKTFDIQRKVAE